MSTFVLKIENGRERMASAWKAACALLELGKPVRVTVDEAQHVRSLEASAAFHAVCTDTSKQKLWAGKKVDTEGWKRLYVDAWARHEGKSQGHVVPSLDGESVVNLGIQTRKLKSADMSDLIEFAKAWAVENNVELRG